MSKPSWTLRSTKQTPPRRCCIRWFGCCALTSERLQSRNRKRIPSPPSAPDPTCGLHWGSSRHSSPGLPVRADRPADQEWRSNSRAQKKPASLVLREAGSAFYIGLICLWPFSILHRRCGSCFCIWSSTADIYPGLYLCILPHGSFECTGGWVSRRRRCLWLPKSALVQVNSI